MAAGGWVLPAAIPHVRYGARQSQDIGSARSYLGIGTPSCRRRSRFPCQVRVFWSASKDGRRVLVGGFPPHDNQFPELQLR